eukprot:235082_1
METITPISQNDTGKKVVVIIRNKSVKMWCSKALIIGCTIFVALIIGCTIFVNFWYQAVSNSNLKHHFIQDSNIKKPNQAVSNSNLKHHFIHDSNIKKPNHTETQSHADSIIAKHLPLCVESLTSNLSGWQWQNVTQQHCWMVSYAALKNCQLSTACFTPLQSTIEDIGRAIKGKWIVFYGDSSMRMLFDYFVGRLAGNYTYWPVRYDNHGPSHKHRCMGKVDVTCSYDMWIQGGHLTFFWSSVDPNLLLKEQLQRTIGKPDILFVEHGYWWSHYKGNKTKKEYVLNLLRLLDEWIHYKELDDEYPMAYTDHTPHKVWVTLYDSYFMKKEAKLFNWTIFDRTVIKRPDTGKHLNKHPMREGLGIVFELILAIIKYI